MPVAGPIDGPLFGGAFVWSDRSAGVYILAPAQYGRLGTLNIAAELPNQLGPEFRDVAQPGSAPEWGSGGRGFESRRPDSETRAQVARVFSCRSAGPRSSPLACGLWLSGRIPPSRLGNAGPGGPRFLLSVRRTSFVATRLRLVAFRSNPAVCADLFPSPHSCTRSALRRHRSEASQIRSRPCRLECVQSRRRSSTRSSEAS
jgi:hypothetical protein